MAFASNTTSSPIFETIIKAALQEYEEQTKIVILTHPLAAQLHSCDSPRAIVTLLRSQVQAFDKSQNERLTQWPEPTVNVIYAFSATFGIDVGMISSPSNVVLTGIGVLLRAVKDVRASKDALVDLFDRLEHLFKRLGPYTEVRPSAAMTEIIVKTIVDLFLILGIVTKEVRQGRTKNFPKKLEGRKEIEESLQRLDQLTHDARATAALTTTRSIDDKVEVIGMDKGENIEGHDEWVHDTPSHEPFEVTPSPLDPHDLSQPLTPPPRASLPTPPPTAARGPPRSFGVVVAAAEVTEPTISITHAAPATSAPAESPFAAFIPSRSRSPAFSERVGGQRSGSDSAIATSSTRGDNSKRKRVNPIEQAKGYASTRAQAIRAIGGVLGTAASVGHEVLFTGVDLLQFAPVPGLDLAGKILLSIWVAVEMVETNRVASLRLIERCADILVSIRDEIVDAGDTIAKELRAPVEKLVKSFEEVHSCLNKLGQFSFLKRYLRRNEILSDISDCNTTLDDARKAFDTSVNVRALKFAKATALGQQDLFQSLSHVSPSLPLSHPPLLPPALQSFPADPESVRNTLHALSAVQNAQDRADDMADLHRLMRAALAAKDDAAIFELFQIARSDMPEAIKTLERTLKRDVKDERLGAEEITMALSSPQEEAGRANGPPVDPSNTDASHGSVEMLDREFIVTGIEALRRLSKGTDLGLPSWTITWLEIDLEKQVGFGSFSDVFRGTWRKHTVAIKVLDKTTPPKIFLREVKIWKSLYHPNVLKIFGASSTSGDPPWFLVCKYHPQGNLVKYLKGLGHADPTRIDVVKMVHEISKGMAYLHRQGVLHGDLKAANILVDDDTSCVISDFGQSEMKSEVYRITCAPQLRGTLRWQAPELMEGAQTLTPEMDVYAFAICCWEILNMGALPWPLGDDNAVRHYVLDKNMRPELPPSNVVSGHLMDVIRTSWDSVPSKRPSFEEIASGLKK